MSDMPKPFCGYPPAPVVATDYERGVLDERARIAKRLRCGWKHAGDDGVYDLLDELESGFHSFDLDAAEVLHTPFKKAEGP